MKGKLYYFFLLFLVLSGCGTNPVNPVPALSDPAKAAEVVVIRGHLIWGAAGSANVTLDGFIICNLFTGEHIRVKVNPGQHSIGTNAGSQALNFESNNTYYFLVNVGFAGSFTTQRITEDEARKLLTNSKEITLK